MFSQLLALSRDGRAGPKERGPHRLAAAAAQAPPDVAVAPLSPCSPSTRLAAAAPTGSSLGSPRTRAAALPAYRALLGRQAQRLPHVQHAAEQAPCYTSLEFLRKLGERLKEKCRLVFTRILSCDGQPPLPVLLLPASNPPTPCLLPCCRRAAHGQALTGVPLP